jgi:hypothetical protein
MDVDRSKKKKCSVASFIYRAPFKRGCEPRLGEDAHHSCGVKRSLTDFLKAYISILAWLES